MKRLVIEGSVPFLRGSAEKYFEVSYLDNELFSPSTLGDTDALIVRSITRCNASLLEGTAVQAIATATAGFDHIDESYCRGRGIYWANAPGCNATAVAQYVFSALSTLSIRSQTPLQGKTIGIVGVGHVGKEVLRLSQAFGMQALLYDPPRAEAEGEEFFCSKEELLSKSDIISLHVPLTHEGAYPTFGMVDDKFVADCRRNPVLINACRGEVSPSDVLVRGRKSGALSALIIDCWQGEPSIDADLLSIADIATPHIAGFSADGKLKGARMALESLCAYFGYPTEELTQGNLLPAPSHPKILWDELTDANRGLPNLSLERAILRTLSLEELTKQLKGDPSAFKALRQSYQYPREMSAYTIVHAPESYRASLDLIGFALEP